MLQTLLLAVVAAALVAAWTTCRTYLRLRHIPGPSLAALTDAWGVSKTWRGLYYHDILKELHKQYGPVVRWGPNRVSFATPSAIPAVLGPRANNAKSNLYDPMVVTSNGVEIMSLITLRDEKRLSAVKKHISGAFSHSTWLKQEHRMDEHIGRLVEVLGTLSAPTRLDKWLSLWALDAMADMGFSDHRDYLAHGRDVDGLFDAIKARFRHWRNWALIPSVEGLLFRNPLQRTLQKPTAPIAKLANDRLQERYVAIDNQSESETSDLLDKFLLAHRKEPEVISSSDVLALTMSTMNAGSETTANATSLIFCNLLGNLDEYLKLQREVLEAKLSFPPGFNEVNRLPYLDAVIRESMRVSLQNPNPIERVITSGPTEVNGTMIPTGTNVSISAICTSRNRELYGADVEAFRPARWLNVSDAQRSEMDSATLAFSYGRRTCIGQHLARIQMKKVVAAIIRHFDLELLEKIDTGFEDNVPKLKLEVVLHPRF